jgi:hypothetical protein
LATELGEHKTVATKAGGGIKQSGADAGLNADGFGDHLSAATPLLATMSKRTLNKIDAHGACGFWAQFLKLKSGFAQLQAEIGFAADRQPEFASQFLNGWQQGWSERLQSDMDSLVGRGVVGERLVHVLPAAFY